MLLQLAIELLGTDAELLAQIIHTEFRVVDMVFYQLHGIGKQSLIARLHLYLLHLSYLLHSHTASQHILVAEQLPHSRCEHLHIEGLRHEAIHSKLSTSQLQVGVVLSGENDNRHTSKHFVVLNPTAHLYSVHHRHHVVDNHQVGRNAATHSQPGAAVGSLKAIIFLTKRVGEKAAYGIVVLHYKYCPLLRRIDVLTFCHRNLDSALYWQHYGECGAATRQRCHRDSTLVQLHKLLCNIQPYSGAFFHTFRPRRLIKSLEDERNIIVGNANSVI